MCVQDTSVVSRKKFTLLSSNNQNVMSQYLSRWDDDVVFKNCAKGVDDARKEKRFINDTLRSEFHKKFMEKYVK